MLNSTKFHASPHDNNKNGRVATFVERQTATLSRQGKKK
jgi:hypothetical protein